MKRFKSCRAYGAFEYVIVAALIALVAILVLNLVKGKTGILNISINTAFSKVDEFIGTGSEVPVEPNPSGITITYSGPFNYDYEKKINVAVTEYFTSFAIVKDKDKNIRTDYVLENISKINGFVQVDVKIDEDGKREQILVVDICHLATDADFSGSTNGTFIYIGSAKCVVIPHVIKGVSVTSYYEMFRGTYVKKIISNNSNIINISRMFYQSQSTLLDLSNFNTTNVTNMSGMFYSSKATSIYLSNIDTSKVTEMGWMFYDSQATTLDLSNFNTSNVANMSSMFRASKIMSLDLSSFNTLNVINMGEMFYVSQLELIKFGESFNTSNVTNMKNMFNSLKIISLDLSSFDFERVLDVSNIFGNAITTEVFVKDLDSKTKLENSLNKPAHTIIEIKE